MIRVDTFAGRTVAVMGLARSGLASVRALVAGGSRVLAWDDAASRQAAAAALGAEVTDLAAADWAGIAALVLSPGIPHSFPAPHPVAAAAKAAGVPVIGDIELLRRAGPAARVVGITGTNGKSTTTALTGHVLRHAGLEAEIGGNIGRAVLDLPALAPSGIYVLELSSYQLELTPSLGCSAAVLLNVTPDHLDRHGGLKGYIQAKRLVFAGQPADSVAILGADDDVCLALAQELRDDGRRVIPVSGERRIEGGIGCADGMLHDDRAGSFRPAVDLSRAVALPGSHNAQNAAAAFAVASHFGVPAQVIAGAMASFPGLAHRQERVAEVAGVLYVNDSKATNADAAARALACYDAIYWIAGGVAKEGGIAALAPLFPRIRQAFLIGAAAPAFAETLGAAVSHEISATLDVAVAAAHAAARKDRRPGAVVLLSPAAASFDQFTDFEARGSAFRDLVGGLVEPERHCA